MLVEALKDFYFIVKYIGIPNLRSGKRKIGRDEKIVLVNDLVGITCRF